MPLEQLVKTTPITDELGQRETARPNTETVRDFALKEHLKSGGTGELTPFERDTLDLDYEKTAARNETGANAALSYMLETTDEEAAIRALRTAREQYIDGRMGARANTNQIRAAEMARMSAQAQEIAK